MAKEKKLKNIFICLIACLTILLSILVFPQASNAFAIDANQTNQAFQVEALSETGISLSGTETTYNGKKAFKHQWKRTINNTNYIASNFKLHFNFDDLASTEVDKINGKYEMTINLEYLPHGYSDSTFDVNGPQVQTAQIASYKDDDYTNFKSYQCPYAIADWGVYRFECKLDNDTSFYSDFFIIEPTLKIDKAPQTLFSQDYSNTGLKSYRIYLQSSSAALYSHIDETSLKWFALGTDKEGKRYVLTSADTTRPEFADAKVLHGDAIDRTGTEFYFDQPEIDGKTIYGTWEIWCEYSYHGASANDVKISNIIKIEVGETNSYSFLWIGLAGLALMAIVTTLTIIIKIKHEKTY